MAGDVPAMKRRRVMPRHDVGMALEPSRQPGPDVWAAAGRTASQLVRTPECEEDVAAGHTRSRSRGELALLPSERRPLARRTERPTLSLSAHRRRINPSRTQSRARRRRPGVRCASTALCGAVHQSRVATCCRHYTIRVSERGRRELELEPNPDR